MKMTLKKIIKAFVPDRIIRLIQQNKQKNLINHCVLRKFISDPENCNKYLLLINDLIEKEQRYGGFIADVKRNKVSPYDPRSKNELETGGMKGGDRMLHNGYACKYAEYLLRFLGNNNITLVEIGILKGSGLAIWCDLFPSAQILGLDIDLGHIQGNMDNLKSLGAFSHNIPELFEFDQFNCDSSIFEKSLNGKKIDICIDDGFHSNTTILNTLQCVEPYLAKNFVYFIEDNSNVHKEIKKIYPQFEIDYENLLTILTRKA